MNGYPVKYLFYESNKKSIVTIPRAILEANNMNWSHGEEIKLLVKTIDGQQGIFLFKNEKKKEEKKK